MILVTREPLDPEAVTATVRSETNGAVVTFLGTTRNETGGRRVLYLEYEAYEGMAGKMLTRIAEEIHDRWGIANVSIAHRFGRLELGEVSMVVAVASPHRAAAFEACQYVVGPSQAERAHMEERGVRGRRRVGGHPRAGASSRCLRLSPLFCLSLSKDGFVSLKTKRIYDPASPEDGYRLLVMRRWPRGIRKDAVDAWEKEIAPSEPLRVAFLHEGMPWEEYAPALCQGRCRRSESSSPRWPAVLKANP